MIARDTTSQSLLGLVITELVTAGDDKENEAPDDNSGQVARYKVNQKNLFRQ